MGDRDRERIEEGRRASMVRGVVGPYIRDRIRDITTLMISHYRGQTADHVTLLGLTAEMSALTQLMEAIDTDISQGVSALETEHARTEEDT